MATKPERRFADNQGGEAGSGAAPTPQVFASNGLPLELSDATDGDARATPTIRGVCSQRRAKPDARTSWAKVRPIDHGEQITNLAMHSIYSRPSAGSRKRVLVAEDDRVVRLLIQNWLEGWGYQVELAEDGTQAWEILRQKHPPELVIMDWMMPDIEGVEISRRLRQEQRDFYQYILLITGRNKKEDIGYALESGVDDCLVKPFGKDELRARLSAASRILELQDNLVQAREVLFDRATKDALTGVWNRAALLDLFQRELDRASRMNTPTGLLILDLDKFKSVNDTYGHLTGDLVLKEAASRLQRAVRSYDLVGRYGGEEFLIAIADCRKDQLCKIAEKIRASVASKPVSIGPLKIPITISIGAVAVECGESSAGSMIAVADIALYRAKDLGRNRTIYCDRPSEELAQSNGALRAICAQCERGLTKQCEGFSQSHLDPRLPVTMSNGSGVNQLPILSGLTAGSSIPYQP